MTGMMTGRKRLMKAMKGNNTMGIMAGMAGAVGIGIAAAMYMRMRSNNRTQ